MNLTKLRFNSDSNTIIFEDNNVHISIQNLKRGTYFIILSPPEHSKKFEVERLDIDLWKNEEKIIKTKKIKNLIFSSKDTQIAFLFSYDNSSGKLKVEDELEFNITITDIKREPVAPTNNICLLPKKEEKLIRFLWEKFKRIHILDPLIFSEYKEWKLKDWKAYLKMRSLSGKEKDINSFIIHDSLSVLKAFDNAIAYSRGDGDLFCSSMPLKIYVLTKDKIVNIGKCVIVVKLNLLTKIPVHFHASINPKKVK